SGTLVLDGDGSGFAGGSTFVDAGTLVVGSTAGNGATLAGDVTVTAGATLGGHGLLQDNVVVQSGARLSPGTSIGTLAVGGNLQLDQGSILDFEFGAPGPDYSTPGVSDRVDVAGDLSIDGATLNVADAGMGAGLYTILSWGGALSQSSGGLVFGSVPAGGMLQL